MPQPRFILNDIVTISSENEEWQGSKCQVKDYNANDDEYYLLILDGKRINQYLWVKAKNVYSWEYYRLIQTIDHKKYQEYIKQLQYANTMRDDIFKNIYGLDYKAPNIEDFYDGQRVMVKHRAAIREIWEHWDASMDATRGIIGRVTNTERKYNNSIGEYEWVVRVEFALTGFYNFTYTYLYLPQHLEIVK